LKNEKLDFVDIITDVSTHKKFVMLAAKYKVPVICQKPMAEDYQTAKKMVEVCKEARVPLMIHENWRWQTPIRALKQKLDQGIIGKPFRARITYTNSFPVFENQPFLAELEQFILVDMGPHILDVARFLLGEARSIYCQTARVHSNIKGKDVASIAMKMISGIHCNVELSYASKIEHDRFPETYILIEGEKGSIELAPDFWLRTTTESGTHSVKINIPRYGWADEQYGVVHASIVDANKDFLKMICKQEQAETTGEDNLKTLELVFTAEQSARDNRTIEIN